MTKQIQWFPGHMAKSLREFKEIKTDLYFIVLDARAPESTFIDSFNEIIKNKKVVIIFTKTDLVNKEDLNKWIKFYNEKYFKVCSLSLKKPQKVKKEILNMLSSIKIKSLLYKIVILGAPNVGKSSLLNIIVGKSKSKVENRPGVTRHNNWYQLEKKYWILDTPGVLQPKFITQRQGYNLASIGSIKIDILPLEDVSMGLFNILKEKNIPNIDNIKSSYLTKEVLNSEKSLNATYKKIIKDFQEQRFGKIILD